MLNKKTKVAVLIVLVFAFSMMLSACGGAESDSSETAAPAEKQMAEGILINNDDVVADVLIDNLNGWSVHFDWNGISLSEGEPTDKSYPLVTVCAFADGAYERQVAEYKDSESFQEENGVITFVDILGERNYLWVVDDKVPVTVVFAESIDKDKAEEIMSCIHITAR